MYFFFDSHETQIPSMTEARYRCPRCGLDTPAVVSTTGHGEAAAPYMVGGEAAQARAESRALANVHENIEALLANTRCPRCGEVNRTAMRRARRRRRRTGAGLMTLTGAGLMSLWAMGVTGAAFVVVGGIVVALGGALWTMLVYEPYRHALREGRVDFPALPPAPNDDGPESGG